MKIVIDMQACQGGSRFRGIGRYSMDLVKAILASGSNHDFIIAMNGALSEGAWEVRRALDGLIDPNNIYLWHSIGCHGGWHDDIPEYSRANFFRWRIDEITRLRREFMASLKPDLVLVCSQFEGFDSVPATSHELVPWAAIIYDFIPHRYSKQYLNTERVRKWYMERFEALKNAEMFLAISEHTKRETIELLNVPPEKVCNIFAAADNQFQPVEIDQDHKTELFEHLGINRDFLIYTGGFDSRKNIESLIRSFTALPSDLRQGHQLILVGAGDHISIPIFKELENSLNVGEGEIIHTGYVSDKDLILLYNTCKMMVFPSLHEGFGLPALEAMSCGAPVIASALTSLPEVIGNPDAYFDPNIDANITNKIVQVLRDEKLRNSLAKNGYERSKQFSWEKSAKKTIDFLEYWKEHSTNNITNGKTGTQPLGYSKVP